MVQSRVRENNRNPSEPAFVFEKLLVYISSDLAPLYTSPLLLLSIIFFYLGANSRFNFWAKDGKAVMFMTETQIKAQEAKDFKDRQAKRARAKVLDICGSLHARIVVWFRVSRAHQDER